MTKIHLSDAALGGRHIRPRKKTYTKHGISVTKLIGQRHDRNKRYPTCVIPSLLGWYPSKTANFVFKSKKFDPDYLWKMGAEADWNPSIWLHGKTSRYVLRVPKDYAKKVWQRLYRRGMWYDPATNLWHSRRRRSRKQGYPSFVQSLSAQKRREKVFGSHREEAKKLFLKISRKK